MALDYYIYSTKTGDLISETRYAGMPFLWSDAKVCNNQQKKTGGFSMAILQ